MAVSQENLVVEVVLDSSGAIKGLKDLNGALLYTEQASEKSSEQINNFEKMVSSLGQTTISEAKNINKSFINIEETIATVTNSFFSITKAAAAFGAVLYAAPLIKQSQAMFDLGSAITSSGGSIAKAKPQLEAFMSSLSNFSAQTKNIKDSLSSLSPIFSAIKSDFEVFSTGLKNSGNIAKTIFSGGLLTIVETSIATGTALGVLGAALTQFDSKLVKITGVAAIVASVLLGSVGVAFNILAGFVGKLVESLGDKLINAMSNFEAKARKLQSVMQAFTFTVSGFNNVYGAEAVGSLQKWQAALEETVRTTIFTREETAKAIKLLVAEGKTLGLSVDQTTTLLAKAKDVAAATGNTLDEVVQRLIAGLAGNSQAVLALGINTSEAALNQLELVKATGKTVSALSEQDKIMARLQEIIIATKPIYGAATAAVTTIAGAYAMFGKRVDEVQAKLGEQGKFTTLYLTFFSNLAEAFLALPPSIISTIGTLQDFLGVVFKVTGVITQYILTIVSLTTILGLASAAITNFTLVQMGLTKVMAFVGSAIGVQTIAVTSLSAVWTNLGILLRGAVLSSFTLVGGAIAAFTKGLLASALAAAPFLLAAAKIGVAIFAIIEGFRIVEQETKVFSTALNAVTNVFFRNS